MKNADKPARLGVCWYPEQWEETQWRRDAEAMRDAGLHTVRLGEFAWSRLQPRRDAWAGGWLQRALDILHACGLQAVIGTPTAAPPLWLLKEMPDAALVAADGRAMAHGSRRHTCHAHAGYRAECARVTEKLTGEFGQHPAVVAWQTDNEYGCHNTARSYSAAAQTAFQNWLHNRYGNIAALNAAWGCAFWSQTYANFSDISVPRQTPAEHNPAYLLDFYRYTSDSIRQFNRLQTDIIRRQSPGRDILHNMMGFTDDFDHFALSQDLDIAAWDSYPLGFLARFGTAKMQRTYLRCGHPDIAAFHHDLYRACGRGRWWVMEQQPGAVNWAAHNPIPAAGMVRLWAWEALAHGAEAVSYFRWRQAAHGQEQMHTALRLPDDTPAAALAEVQQTAAELKTLELTTAQAGATASVALLVDYAALWMGNIQPHGDLLPMQIILQYYSAFRRYGVNVDIINSDDDFADYHLLVAPLLFSPLQKFIARLKTFLGGGGVALFGARSGSKTDNFAIPHNLPPGVLADILGLRVVGVDSLPPERDEEWLDEEATDEKIMRWQEVVTVTTAHTVEPHPFLYANGNAYYFAARANSALMCNIIAAVLKRANISAQKLPPHIRSRRHNNQLYLFNYGADEATVDFAAGNIILPPWKKCDGGDGIRIPPADMLALQL